MSKTLFTALVLLLLVTPAFAQDPAPQQEPQAPPAAPVDPAEAGGAGTAPVRIGPVTISGSGWVESIFVNDKGSSEEAVSDMFRIRRARLGLAGNIAPRIGWNISGEFTAEPILRNAFIQFRINEQFIVRAGQATPPSSLERGTSPLVVELIDRARITSQLTSGLDPSVTLMNQRPYKGWLGYAVTVANGSGFNRADNNNAKDVVAKLEITPTQARGLTIVGSGSTGEQPEGRRKRSGLGVQYENSSVKILVEGLQQTLGGVKSKGGFMTVVYRIRPRSANRDFHMLELAGRYMVFHDRAPGGSVPDEDGGGGPAPGSLPPVARELQTGANYYFTSNVRFMGNLVIPTDHRETPGISFLTRLQVVF